MSDSANSLDYDCDWKLGFNLDPSSTGTIGYLLFWSGCGGLGLAKDIEVWNPYTGGGQTVVSGDRIKCIGLIETFRHSGDAGAPIRITAYVSKETAANVRAKVAAPMSTTSVQVSWYILGYDDERKEWFEAAFLKDSKNAKCAVDIVGGTLQLFIENKGVRVDDRLDLKVYKLEFQIVPTEGETTEIEFATGSTQKLVKSWAPD